MTTTRIIKVVPYDPNWPHQFEQEAAKIAQAFGDNLVTTHHIGSTSVEGLAAKPIIDMIPVVKDILAVDTCNEAMVAQGYTVKGEYGIPFRRFFSKEGYNVHVFEQGSTEILRHLNFTAFLGKHPVYLKAYAELKANAALAHAEDIVAYCNAKDALIQEIDSLAGIQYLRVVKTLLDSEWLAYHRIYEEQVHQKNKALYSPEAELFSLPEHHHFVLRKGNEIIGILHLEFIRKKNATIHALALDKPHQSKENENYLFEFAKKWLRHQGKILI
ncbi:MAG: GrpB family protein [Proteobacteria bacterium]|nr:GrpB family protein [Pseudomonadota bacterium]